MVQSRIFMDIRPYDGSLFVMVNDTCYQFPEQSTGWKCKQ